MILKHCIDLNLRVYILGSVYFSAAETQHPKCFTIILPVSKKVSKPVSNSNSKAHVMNGVVCDT